MLSLKNICVNYDNQIIYDHADFCAHHNTLTVVIGKSGSGKSTLHQIITFHDIGKCEYYYDNRDMSQLSYSQKQEFIKTKMGIVNQTPAFIDDLTINDHISLCQSLWDGYDVEEYIERLQIEHVLNEYPQQLSGGEKIRVSILLAMIHQPEILVFDEPTASLDKHHSQLIVQLLKEYAHLGHIVVIFTHDKLMKNEGDIVYQIENKTLDCIHQNNQRNEKSHTSLRKKSTQHYLQYIYKMFKHRKLLKVCMLGFVAFAIASSCFSIFYGNSVIDKYRNQLGEFNKAGVICRNTNYSKDVNLISNLEPPIGEEELKIIQGIKHMDKIWPYIMSNDDSNIISNNVSSRFRVFQNQKLIIERERDKEELSYDLGTYNEEYDYPKKELVYEFNVDEGIYIEKYFLYYLITGEIMDDITKLDQDKFKEAMSSVDAHTEIEFPILVPYYVETQEYQEVYYKQMSIKMKIKGICSRPQDFELCKEFGTYTNIFYPIRIEEEYRQKINKVPLPTIDSTDNGEDKVTIPFYPIYYQFTVDDDHTFSEVKEEIEALGYKVSSSYYDKEVQVLIAKDVNKGISMVSGLIVCVVLMLLFGVKYNQKKEYLDFIHFFTNRGMTYKKSKQILSYYFIYEAILCSIVSMLMMGVIIFIFFMFIYQEIFVVRITFFVFCIILAFIIEVGIPLLIIRSVKK